MSEPCTKCGLRVCEETSKGLLMKFPGTRKKPEILKNDGEVVKAREGCPDWQLIVKKNRNGHDPSGYLRDEWQ